jgi:hypothetical protein
MFAARLINVILFIMAILIPYNHQFREMVVDNWEKRKPVGVQ